MTKSSGLAEQFFVDEFNVSGDVGGIDQADSPTAVLLVTGIDKEAVERQHGQRDGMLDFKAYMNDATGAAHDALSTLPTDDVQVSWLLGKALGAKAASIIAKQVGYEGARDEEGNLTFTVSAAADGTGLEWGHNLTGDGTTGIFTSAGAENCPGFDDGAGAATNFGLQVYFHLLSFTGTSITLTIEDSDDDAAVDPYATVTGATSGALTGAGAVRVQTGRTENVKEWLRVAASGTYSAATFVVVVVRNKHSVVF